MSDSDNRDIDYIGYEYKEITVPMEYMSLYMDNYPCFGWESDPNRTDKADKPGKNMTLHWHRNRKITNRTELTRLQRNFDALVTEIKKLEASKEKLAAMYSLITGFIGLAFIAGSVLAVTAQPVRILLCVLLGIPGILLWLAAYPVYLFVLKKRTEAVTTLIEDKYDQVYEVCEKGKRLLF